MTMLRKVRDVLGLFLTTLKTLAPRTPVKLLLVCTNTTHYFGLFTTIEDKSTTFSQNARKHHPCHTASYLVRLESLTFMCKVYNLLFHGD
jgi:hypothetical protein